MSAAAGTIAVLDYGIGNLRSAEKALVHLGAPARLVQRPEEVEGAAGVVLPGVGAFGACCRALAQTGLGEAATRAVAAGVPFLGICVGFQLLYEASEESPGAEGLGVFEGTIRRLTQATKLPQMQWNRLERRPGTSSGLLASLAESPWVYFVHSYAPPIGPETVATCDYDGPVSAVVERDNVWGTQFHPEKSSTVGLDLLANFVTRCTLAPVSAE